MDYQEAIKEAEIQIDMYESMILYNKDFEPKNDNSNYERKLDFLKTAISAMQELQKQNDDICGVTNLSCCRCQPGACENRRDE